MLNVCALLGVDLVIVGRRPRMVSGGTTLSLGVMESAQGLFEGSSAILFPVLLSLLRSRMLFGSPFIAWCLVRPDALEPELDSAAAELDATLLEVSMTRPLLGDLPLLEASSSTHPAGVGGTGPNIEVECVVFGRLVGGDVMARSVVRLILCDLPEGGGGPGGGGGNGIPGAHLEVEEPRGRGVEGVLIAPVETALREEGGLVSASNDWYSNRCKGSGVKLSG